MKKFSSVFLSIIKTMIGITVFFLILFGSAGTFYWIEVWIFITLYFLFVIFLFLWLKRKDPELLKERTIRKKEGKWWDKLLLSLYSLLLLAMFAVCGLDAMRYHWTSAPTIIKCIGFFGIILSGILIFRTIVVNKYLSAVVRIQNDRAHYVITTGPYQYVRHPMYVGIILLVLAIPPALGSMIGLIFSGLIIIIFIIRTELEDKTLQRELPGYIDYSKKVHCRLMPGIW